MSYKQWATERETYQDADAADEHRPRERTPVVVPFEAAVTYPDMVLVLAHAVQEADVNASEEEERGELHR